MARLIFAIKTNVILLESSKSTVKQSAKVSQIRRNYYNKRKIHPEITNSFGVTIISGKIVPAHFCYKNQCYFAPKFKKHSKTKRKKGLNPEKVL